MKRTPWANQQGFTLIEIMVTLTIIVLIIGVALPTLSGLSAVKEKQAVRELTGTIRYLFDKAQLDHKYIRLVFDLDNNSYRAEEANNPVTLTRQKLEVVEGRVQEPEEEEELSPEEENQRIFENFDSLLEDRLEWQGWYNFKEKLRRKMIKFSEYKDDVIKTTKLPDGVKILGVYTLSLSDKATAGEVSLFFFPNGFVEPAVIYLGAGATAEEEEGEVWSLRVDPLTGDVKITLGEIPLPDFEEEARDEEELF